MNTRVIPLTELTTLHTRLFKNCFADVSETTANQKANETTNAMLITATHIVGSRFYIAKLLGNEATNPLDEIKNSEKSLTVQQVQDAWQEAHSVVISGLKTVSGETLDKDTGVRFPIENTSLLHTLAFLLHHEAYHIGQLSQLRRYFGYDAMSYS